MNYSLSYLRLFNETKASLKILAFYSVGRYTQLEASERAQAWITGFIEKAPKSLPKGEIGRLWAYWEGLKDAAWNDQTVFLYKVGGKFYSVSHSKTPEFPSWDTLPREQWDSLGEHGGIYWRGTYAPFYIS